MGCRCDTKTGLIVGAVLAGVAALLGAILIPVGNMIIESTVKKETVLEQGTTAYETWTSVETPVYRQFWIYNVQNPWEVVQEGAKPIVQEKGPYTYRTRYLMKENITANSNNTVSFSLPSGAIFEPGLSVGSEQDVMVIINIAVAAAYSLIPQGLHFILNTMINNSGVSLFQNRTVHELLWGYTDPTIGSVIGVFYPYNDTYDGPYNVFSGKDDISKVALIDRWRDASSFPPFVDKKKTLYFFSSDICRSVMGEFTGSVDLKGIEVYRYMLPKMTLAAPTVNPDNMCYCKDPVLTLNCTVAGVLDISSCRDGTPILISLPHFLHGSPELVEALVGLNPNEDHHSTFLDVEPITGFTLNFAKRLQVNIMYGPSKVIEILQKVQNNTIIPILWLNETATLDDATADRLKGELFSRVEMLEAVQISLMVIGVVLCVAFGVAACVVKRKSRNSLA
uniref:Platelet glycoprotein 4 n=1 Tax=Denticeps clupeoides TaxID=299321 RepID=A0AAY4CFV2_9TELE